MVDWFCQPKTDSLLSVRVETPPEKEPPPEIPPAPSFHLEPDRIAGLGKDPPTPEDELVTIFLSSMAGHIMKRCETQDCLKRIDIIKPSPPPPPAEVSEEEDAEPAQDVKEEKKAASPTKYTKRKSKVGGAKSATTGGGGENRSKKTTGDRDTSKANAVDEVEEEETEHMKESQIAQRAARTSKSSIKNEKSLLEEDEAVYEEELSPETKIVKKHRGKSYASMEEIDARFHSWRFRELDQMMDADFIQNNRYEGRTSRILMEEFGKFTWKNGQTYKGTFKKGWCVGHGLIEWNANSIYEGEVYCNMRHGFGVKTYVDGGNRMYHAGHWKMGKKHGEGISVYDEDDWYDGNWNEGEKHGIGTRRYKNGAKYHGMWYKGMRHGKGTMVWPNNDVYMGDWYFGQMQGKGKYTWNSFRNEKFISPMQNVYTGEWSNNLRHGEGVLELMTGGIIRTTWYDGQKSGTADIICRNGDVLHMPDLFKQDRVAPVTRTASFIEEEKKVHRRRSIMNDQNFVKMRFHNDQVDEEIQISDTSLGAENVNENLLTTPVVPINSPVHTMDYRKHINKLFEIKCSSLLPLGPSDPKPPVIPPWEKKAIMWLENKWLQKVIVHRMGELTKVYNFYSTILSDLNIPEFKFCMYRLSLWLLMKHCGLAETGISTIALDKMVDFGYDPFDKVMMYEMINYLLVMSWLRYVPKRIRNPDIPGIIASCFDKFIEDVVINAPSQYDGSFHKFLKFTPFDALEGLYSSFEYPMRIEDLCARLVYISGKDFEDKLPFTPPYFKYVLQGKNVVGPDGYIAYIPFEIPNFDINLMKLRPEVITPAELRVLGLIGIDNIVRCIKEAVPEAINPVNDELMSEYELSFNDFCDILVNLVTLYLDMSEDFYRKLLDAEEKQRTGEEPQWASEGGQMGPGGKPAAPGEGFAKPAESKGGPQRKSMKRKSMKRKSMK